MNTLTQLRRKAVRPFDHDWEALSGAERHGAALELVSLVLDVIDAEGRPPSSHELLHLTSAISALRLGLQTATFGFVQRALDPEPQARRGLVGLHRDDGVSVGQLREQLFMLPAMPPARAGIAPKRAAG